MADNENEVDEKPFVAEIAKQGRAACRKCKKKCASGELRLAKLGYNPYGSDKMKQWYHPPCLFETFLTQRPTTARLETVEDIEGYENLDLESQNVIQRLIDESEEKLRAKWGEKYTKKTPKTEVVPVPVPEPKEMLFRDFRRLVANITNESSYLEKTAVIKKLFTKGKDGKGFQGDIIQWCRLLLPGVIIRIYNLGSRQLTKLFSRILGTSQDEMLHDLEKGDIGETIQRFFEESVIVQPCKKSIITIREVDEFLDELSMMTKEEEQVDHFNKIVKKCTSNDLKIIIRLIKHDLRMNAGAKHVLDAIHPNAYENFQSSHDLKFVLSKIFNNENAKNIKASISVMTPVLPMLAEACKSVEYAMRRCPSGMFSEIKYDGERVQLHKHGKEFKYFSRSLKPVQTHKVKHFKEYIPLAFPHARDLILDAEVLLVDCESGKPLPFGSLGIHKKTEFQNAKVCLFVFDCIYYNGEVLTHKPMKERRKVLMENMTEIKNHIMFSEVQEIHKPEDLTAMITKVLKLGLEGLVLKDLGSIYEPGKRHWLKVKKDYLCGGAMADSADLIVLGAWFGTGRKGGLLSVFLMGCYDERRDRFLTVTKVHTGHDDKTLERLQGELKMVKISGDMTRVPSWLKCTKTMVPDFVAEDPKNQPVWEVTGAEFTQHEVHTADGISIRFPRVTKIRDDKTWKEATTLEELKLLVKNSKELAMDFSLLQKGSSSSVDSFVKVESNEQMDTNNGNVKRGLNAESDKVSKKTRYDDAVAGPSWKTDDEISNLKENGSHSDEDSVIAIDPSKKYDNLKLKNGERSPKKGKKDFFDDTTKRKTKNSPRKQENSSQKQESPEVNNKPVKMKSLFSNIFENVRVFLTDSNPQVDELVRYFLAYGGVLTNNKPELTTHVIHINDEVSAINRRYPSDARHVVYQWISDSVGNMNIQDTRPYAVRWVPTMPEL